MSDMERVRWDEFQGLFLYDTDGEYALLPWEEYEELRAELAAKEAVVEAAGIELPSVVLQDWLDALTHRTDHTSDYIEKVEKWRDILRGLEEDALHALDTAKGGGL